MLNRRTFLGSFCASAVALTVAGRARAQAAPSTKKFLFLFAAGGWDPLHALVPLFGRDQIQMSPTAEPMTIGRMQLVDGPGRPAVRNFFTRWYERSLLWNGVSTRSVAHDVCTMIASTGSSSLERPDWGTQLAAAARDSYALPHLQLSGVVFPHDQGSVVAKIGAFGQLQTVVDGTLLTYGDIPVTPTTRTSESVLDRFLARRSAAFRTKYGALDPRAKRLGFDYDDTVARTASLKALRDEINFGSAFDLRSQAATAIDAMSKGICRVASIFAEPDPSSPQGWDTHSDNDVQQTANFQHLFTELDIIMDLLAATTGPTGVPLSEDTIIVLTSEMGRTPAYNPLGRDHWPSTSVLIVGNGVQGDRVIGGFDDGYIGLGLDPATGDIDPARPASMTSEDVGATLLALGGVDPAETLLVPPVTGILT
jgi:hypothetical protein